MTNVTLPIGATNSGTNDWADVHNEDQAIVDVVNGGIDNANIAASAGIVDTKLASPNNSVYKTLQTRAGSFTDSLAGGAAKYLIPEGGTSGASPLTSVVGCFYINGSSYTVGSLTTRLRVRSTIATNGTAAAVTFTGGLYPVTFSGSGLINTTAGTVVTSSTAAVASPAANSAVTAVSSDFAVPTDGTYSLGFALSGTPAVGSEGRIFLQLEFRHT